MIGWDKHKFTLRAIPTSETLEGRLLRTRYVDKDRVDMDLLRRWMLLCEEDHDQIETSPSNLALDSGLTLGVIDVQNDCLGQPTTKAEICDIELHVGTTKHTATTVDARNGHPATDSWKAEKIVKKSADDDRGCNVAL